VTVGVPTPVTALAAQSAGAQAPEAQLTFTEDDRRHMARALGLAARGLFTTTPNPRVGCVIVRDGRVLGEGFHERAGLAHAEVAALADARASGHDVRGATLYVTLEPCNRHGRTPPCTTPIRRRLRARSDCASTALRSKWDCASARHLS